MILFLIIFAAPHSWSAYSNYNSVLIGQEASGLGGAYTALSGDPAASSFYNPATLTQMNGSTLSATVSSYQKLNTTFGDEDNFNSDPTRVNKGFFEPVPSSAGSVISYGHYALAFSILIPDYSTFSGELESNDNITSFLNFTDESLWVGGSLAFNLSKQLALGMSFYYTARKFQRSVSDQLKNGTDVEATIEDKNFTQNSLVYIFGLLHKTSPNWSVGLSIRPPSIPISGEGSFFQSNIDTSPDTFEEFSFSDLKAETRIPLKASLGVAYRIPQKYTLSFDLSYYGKEKYQDLDLEVASDFIEHTVTLNFAVGFEYFFESWLSGRIGYFTNASSHPTIDTNLDQRQGDHINMKGVSANMTYHSSQYTQFTFGGYWTGGTGESFQQIGKDFAVVRKSLNIFTMLIGSSYSF